VTGSACSDQPSISLGLLRLDCRWFGSFVVFGLLGLSEIAISLAENIGWVPGSLMCRNGLWLTSMRDFGIGSVDW
jgi:hypothetical protein